MEFKLNCINIWNKVSVLRSFSFVSLCTNLSIQFLLSIIHLLHTLFQTVREQLQSMCFKKMLCIWKESTCFLGRQCQLGFRERWQVRENLLSDVIVLHWFTIDITVMNEDSHHALEYTFFHLAQFGDLLSYCLHTDVCRQLPFPSRCINSSCGRHIRIKTRIFHKWFCFALNTWKTKQRHLPLSTHV